MTVEDYIKICKDACIAHPASYLRYLKSLDIWDDLFNILIESTAFLSDKVEMKTRLYCFINGIHDAKSVPKCSCCKRHMTYRDIRNMKIGYPLNCCPSCAKNSDVRKLKYIATCEKKYGHEIINASQADEVKQQKAETTFSNYGVINPSQSGIISNKIRSTNIHKYGSASPQSSVDVQKKTRETCLIKYGCVNYQSTDDCKEKVKKSNMKRFGVEYPNKDPVFRRMAQKRYFYNGKRFDSKPELAFYIYCVDHNINVECSPDTGFSYRYDGSLHSYIPDFIAGHEYIEIKGPQFFENGDYSGKMINPYDRSQDGLYEAKHRCMLENGVRIIGENEYSKYIAYVENKYGKMYMRSFKNRKDSENDGE